MKRIFALIAFVLCASNVAQAQFVIFQDEATAARRRFLVYLVDDTDGKTAETGVTISAGDVKISENGAAEANHAGTLTELATGTYYYELAAAEVDTPGFLQFKLTKSGVRTFVKEIQIMPAVTAQTIADTTLATTVETEGTYTLQQVLSITLAVLAGRSTDSGLTFKTPNNNATRVQATVDGSKNRTAMTLSPSS